MRRCKKTPRPYQIEADLAVHKEFETHESTLLVLPTGMGKTFVAANLMVNWPHGNSLFLAHTTELIEQSAAALEAEMDGYKPIIEMNIRGADRYQIHTGDLIAVGSVQSFKSDKRLAKYEKHPFGLIVVDEAHRGTAPSYRKIIQFFRERNPSLKVLGITATPQRADGISMGTVFQSCAFQLTINKAIEDGWLTPIQQKAVAIKGLDFSGLKTRLNALGDRDFSAEQLEAIVGEEETLQAFAKAILELAGERSTLVFTPGVKSAYLLASILNRHKDGSAKGVDGETPKQLRPEIVAEFRNGRLQFLCNAMLFCLDEETEILTDDGWVGIDGIHPEMKVANWDNGDVFFDYPHHILKRERHPNEKMVVLETPRRSIRVTQDHRMLYRTWRDGAFKILHASDMVNKVCEVPVSGRALPKVVHAPRCKQRLTKRAVRANSYVLRQSGMEPAAARLEAIERLTKRDELNYAEPFELTNDECELIGFWTGDGSINRPRGGIEYTLFQLASSTNIVERVDHLLAACDIDAIKRVKKYPSQLKYNVRWSLPRGTGFGPQTRRGVFRIEPYLQKDGSDLLWGLTEEQFDSFLRGLWMADGTCHNDDTEPPKYFAICGANRALFDRLQAIACCRGYRCSMFPRPQKNPKHLMQYVLTFEKETSHRMTKYRMQFEDAPWKKERVWCVTSTTGNIITRRRGTVTVTGNTEGFDAPNCSCIAMCRPTKSVGLYIQMLGRGLRPLPGTVDGLEAAFDRKTSIFTSAKRDCLVLDFAGNSEHKLVDVWDVLGGDYDVETVELAEQDGGKQNVMEDLNRAAMIRQLMLEWEERKPIVADSVSYTAYDVDPYGGPSAVNGNQTAPRGNGASPGQIGLLMKLGVSREKAESVSKRQAGAMINEIGSKRCTGPQAKTLVKFGVDPEGVGMDRASDIIDAIARNGWKPLSLEQLEEIE